MHCASYPRAQEGLVACDLGDYPAAFRILRPLAEEGDSQVQLAIGYMYDHGLGTAQDRAQALCGTAGPQSRARLRLITI